MPSFARPMLDTYRRTFRVSADMLATVIDALTDCAQACMADVSADLGDQDVTEMILCIRLCLDCAETCAATAGVVSRAGRLRGECDQAAPGGLRGQLHHMRGRVRATCREARSLPALR